MKTRRNQGLKPLKLQAQGITGFGNCKGDFGREDDDGAGLVTDRRVEDATGGEEAANGLEHRERETGDGCDADRRSFSGEVAGVIRNHKDDEARRRRV
ncbi:hypothetical protein U1Q18_051930 [Sarracenia purpurea var. burkii]